MITEIGHFYTKDTYQKGCLNYLRDQPIYGCPIIFIDDYSEDNDKEFNLDIDELKNEAILMGIRNVEVMFESDMVSYKDWALTFLDHHELDLTEFGGNIQLKDGLKNLFIDLNGRLECSCLFLSFIWTLFRLREGSTHTIIDKKYKKIEERVVEMLPENLRKQVSYSFI